MGLVPELLVEMGEVPPEVPVVAAAADVNWASDDVGVSTDTTKATR